MNLKGFLIYVATVSLLVQLLDDFVLKPARLIRPVKPYTLIWENKGTPVFYPVLDGSDVAIPFSHGSRARWEAIGFSRYVFRPLPGSWWRDSRYPKVWR